MHFTSRFRRAWLIVIVLIMVLLFTGCDSYQVIILENRTTSPIKADIRSEPLDYSGTPNLTWDAPVPVIEIGKSQGLTAPIQKSRLVGVKRKYPIIAIIETGEVVFSKIFTWDELHDMGWRVVISQQ